MEESVLMDIYGNLVPVSSTMKPCWGSTRNAPQRIIDKAATELFLGKCFSCL